VGAGKLGLGRRRHPGPRAHLLYEMGSLEIDPRVVVGGPSNNLKVSVTDSQVLLWVVGTYCIGTSMDYVCMTATGNLWVFKSGLVLSYEPMT
jgi:hypothetical protein